METLEVSDLYQASWLLLNSCELSKVQCIPTGGSVSCLLQFSGTNLIELMDTWFTKQAVVNLWAFRTAYNQINSYVHQAKKNFDLSKRGGSL
jgi:hypothetical protein